MFVTAKATRELAGLAMQGSEGQHMQALVAQHILELVEHAMAA